MKHHGTAKGSPGNIRALPWASSAVPEGVLWIDQIGLTCPFGENSIEFSLESSEIKRWREQRKMILQRVVEKSVLSGTCQGVTLLQTQGKCILSVLDALLKRNVCLPVFVLVFLLG